MLRLVVEHVIIFTFYQLPNGVDGIQHRSTHMVSTPSGDIGMMPALLIKKSSPPLSPRLRATSTLALLMLSSSIVSRRTYTTRPVDRRTSSWSAVEASLRAVANTRPTWAGGRVASWVTISRPRPREDPVTRYAAMVIFLSWWVDRFCLGLALGCCEKGQKGLVGKQCWNGKWKGSCVLLKMGLLSMRVYIHDRSFIE